MEILGQRPVWSMSGSEMLSSLDAAYAEIARLETFALHLIAGLESTGHAQELGAGTTARLLTFRYRIDATKARRDVHLATRLDKFPAVAAALPIPMTDDATTDTGASDTNPANNDVGDSEQGAGADGAGADGAGADGAGADGAGEHDADEDGAGVGVLLHPAQAEAIVSALDKVPATVPADDLLVAEREMVELGRTHGPLDLRRAGRLVRDRLDTDGPEPNEQKAYDRESLTLKNADNGVAFRGYLANENAELFRTLIHAHAKPRKTIDGALDPRGRDKRQADALTTVLTAANNPTHSAGHHATPTATGSTQSAGHHATPAAAATAGVSDATPHQDLRRRRSGGGGDPAADDMAGTLPGMRDAADGPAQDPAPGTAEAAGSAPTEVGRGHGGGFIPGHGSKPHITVTIDYNDLKAATADKLGHLIYGDALSAATIRRLACDAHILPIVLGSDSQPLDVGTTVRLATGPIRKALITRDKGCVCCGAPPLYCDAHHVKSWIDGGETKITNLVLLCKRCHRDLHAGHWTIQITNGVVEVARPAWATPGPVPRDRYRPPTTTPNTTKPTPRSSRRGAADATTLGVTTPGAPARAWPRDTDPPWITAEDAARLNPWGDDLDEPNPHTRARPPAADFDPWGDGGSSIANADCRSKLGTGGSALFGPSGDRAWKSGDRGSADDDSSTLKRGPVDPWRDSAERRVAPTTAA
ncbi:DUF222 domain-containing protein [Kribbella sp. CWNU-51]